MSYIRIILLLNLFSTSLYAADRITIHGVVVNQTGRAPIAGATVSIVGIQGNTTTTDSDGKFSMLMQPGVSAGSEVSIRASKPGFKTYSGMRIVADRLDREIELIPVFQLPATPIHHLTPPVIPPALAASRIVENRPGAYLSIMLPVGIKLVLTVDTSDETASDVLVRFTDVHGTNRDPVNEEVIRRIAGPTYEADLRQGIGRLGGDLGGHGTGFTILTRSNVPGQTVCTTFVPLYKDDPFAANRLSEAYDTCFGSGTMTRVFSISFPGYGGPGSDFPIGQAAPIVVDRLLSGLGRTSGLKQLTIVVAKEAFSTYSQLIVDRLKVHL